MLFDFLNDMYNYDSRKIDRYDDEDKGLCIDTCRVSDGEQDYETAVAHPEYHDGKFVIVEAYDTPEEAQIGHNKWIDIMTAENLPEELVDCCNAEIGQLCYDLGRTIVYKRKENK